MITRIPAERHRAIASGTSGRRRVDHADKTDKDIAILGYLLAFRHPPGKAQATLAAARELAVFVDDRASCCWRPDRRTSPFTMIRSHMPSTTSGAPFRKATGALLALGHDDSDHPPLGVVERFLCHRSRLPQRSEIAGPVGIKQQRPVGGIAGIAAVDQHVRCCRSAMTGSIDGKIGLSRTAASSAR